DTGELNSTRELRVERRAIGAARERIARVRPSAEREIVALIGLDDADCRTTLIAVPRAELCTLGIDVPHEQSLTGEVSVGADALPVLEQQVVARLSLHPVHGAALLHGLQHEQRIRSAERVHRYPAELLLLPRTEMGR